jgi:hypothetical protein
MLLSVTTEKKELTQKKNYLILFGVNNFCMSVNTTSQRRESPSSGNPIINKLLAQTCLDLWAKGQDALVPSITAKPEYLSGYNLSQLATIEKMASYAETLLSTGWEDSPRWQFARDISVYAEERAEEAARLFELEVLAYAN